MFDLQNSPVICFFLFLLAHYFYIDFTSRCSDLLRWQEVLVSKNLKLKNVCCPLSQIPYTIMSSLVLFVIIAVVLFSSLPVRGAEFGSMSVLLQTSYNIFIVRSPRSLCQMDIKPPFLQLIQCLNILPQGHAPSKVACFINTFKDLVSEMLL